MTKSLLLLDRGWPSIVLADSDKRPKNTATDERLLTPRSTRSRRLETKHPLEPREAENANASVNETAAGRSAALVGATPARAGWEPLTRAGVSEEKISLYREYTKTPTGEPSNVSTLLLLLCFGALTHSKKIKVVLDRKTASGGSKQS